MLTPMIIIDFLFIIYRFIDEVSMIVFCWGHHFYSFKWLMLQVEFHRLFEFYRLEYLAQ